MESNQVLSGMKLLGILDGIMIEPMTLLNASEVSAHIVWFALKCLERDGWTYQKRILEERLHKRFQEYPILVQVAAKDVAERYLLTGYTSLDWKGIR